MAEELKFVTIVRKFNNNDGTFFKFEKLKLPATIAGEGADEIFFSSNAKISSFLINGCVFDLKSHSLSGKSINQNFELGFEEV